MQSVLEAYRAMEPVKELLERIKTHFAIDPHWATLDFQAQVVQIVIRDPICEKFAPARKYTYNFLKQYVHELEAISADIDDDIATTLLEFVLNPKLLNDSLNIHVMHHVSYTVPSSIIVTCRVASVMNDVGLKIWEAGYLLAEYIIAHKSEFQNRNVLELGAGVGFTGIILACVGRSKRIILSDYAPNVLQNLRYNVELNADKFKCPIQVQTLDWETWQPLDDERPDLLLAGDCVYDVSVFPALIHALESFFGHQEHGTTPQRVAIFAATIRNHETFEAFLDQLARHDIQYTDITLSTGTQLFLYPNRDQIRLCRLSKSGKHG